MSQGIYEVSLDRVANQPPAEGMHTFLITQIDEGESKENQNPMWTVRLNCETEGPDKGKEVTMWLVLIPSMRWKIEKFLDAVGAPPTGSAPAKSFLGRRFRAQITHRKGTDGRTFGDVGEMFPAGSTPASKPAATSTTRVQSAQAAPVTRTGKAATAVVPGKGKPTGSKLPPEAQDDIPFETT